MSSSSLFPLIRSRSSYPVAVLGTWFPTARFWGLLAKLLESPEVVRGSEIATRRKRMASLTEVLATNNPLLTEQIAFQVCVLWPWVKARTPSEHPTPR